jgi:hypothetical protein
MRARHPALAMLAVILAAQMAHAAENPALNPGCEQATARQCLTRAMDALGGELRLRSVTNVRLQLIGHTALVEQSYRQAPFITSYAQDTVLLDLRGQRIRREEKLTWPESDAGQAESDATLIVVPGGGVYRGKDGDTPCSRGDLEAARLLLAQAPAFLLAAAAQAPDLHFEPPAQLRGTLHSVIAFTWQGTTLQVLLNRFNHYPDALASVRQFHDFWYFWGDVRQLVYLDNWKRVDGLPYPTNIIEERNGILWSSSQALAVEFNVSVAPDAFAADAAIAARSAASHGWELAFAGKEPTVLAPGIELFPGAWNATLVRQDDGILILESPISSVYTQGVVEEAARRYPGTRLKAVLTTSDSWPHVGGVRYAVAKGLPVYVLDLNQPLLERLAHAPHTLEPDALEHLPHAVADWRIVSGTMQVGTGANRAMLYPVRGASTERQYLVFFPERHLLYASDTLALNEDGSLYDPQLMSEVAHAVEREHLQVETVFAMHQGPVSWKQVQALLTKAGVPGV